MRHATLVAILIVICCAAAAEAGRLDGSVFLMPIETQFSSVGRAEYFNDINQRDSATLTGSHVVSGAGTFHTPVQGDGSYNYVLEGPASQGACYGTSLSVTADPPGWFNTISQSWSGGIRCAPSPEPPNDPPCPEGECGEGDEEYNPPNECDESPCSPILIDMARNGLALTDLRGGVEFDIDGDGDDDRVSWTAAGADDAFLWLDTNGNDAVDGGRELFGDAEHANGFAKLAAFDRNGDGMIDAADPVWPRLRLWTDADHDGRSNGVEIAPLSSSRFAAIDLRYQTVGKRDRLGNRYRFKSRIYALSSSPRPEALYDVLFVKG